MRTIEMATVRSRINESIKGAVEITRGRCTDGERPLRFTIDEQVNRRRTFIDDAIMACGYRSQARGQKNGECGNLEEGLEHLWS